MSCSAALQALALPGAIQSWASGTDERVRMHVCVHVCLCVCVWTNCLVVVSLSLLLIYLSVVSLFQRLLASLLVFYPCDSSSSSSFPLPIALSVFPSVLLVFVSHYSSHTQGPCPPLQRSVECNDGGGRKSAHWFFWQGNVKVCKPVCKCHHLCVAVWLTEARELMSWVFVRAYVMRRQASRGSRWASIAATELRGLDGGDVGVDGLHHRFCMIKLQMLIRMGK